MDKRQENQDLKRRKKNKNQNNLNTITRARMEKSQGRKVKKKNLRRKTNQIMIQQEKKNIRVLKTIKEEYKMQKIAQAQKLLPKQQVRYRQTKLKKKKL